VDRNQIILAVVAAVLIVFALTVSMVVPRRNPQFPGRKLGAFFLVSMALVAGMLTTVVVLGGEDAENEASAAAETGGAEGAQPAETGAPAESQPAETGAPAETGGAESGRAETGGAGAPAGDPGAGKQVFESAGCTACHTLADAGATGTVGPNLDQAKPPYDLVVDRVTNGMGVMPSFKGQLSETQIQDVAAYVAQATSG
jgi:mono/diheme cytochrome c family protein